jgi:hypothetical protein
MHKDWAGERFHHAGIAEEAEQIDELSNDTLGQYIRKSAGQMATNAMAAGVEKNKGNQKAVNATLLKALKRQHGIGVAVKKIVKENMKEAEQINELSNDTLKSYIKKAGRSAANIDDSEEHLRYLGNKWKNTSNKLLALRNAEHHKEKSEKRLRSIIRAAKKINEEAEQIDEVSSHSKRKGLEVIKYGDEYRDYDGSYAYGPEDKYVPIKSDPEAVRRFGFDYDSKKIGTKDDFKDPRKANRIINRYKKGKLKEEVEQIDELSNEKMMDYAKKARRSRDTSSNDKTVGRRIAGLTLVSKRAKANKALPQYEEIELSEARQMTPALKAAQNNLLKIRDGTHKREEERRKRNDAFSKQNHKDVEKYNKERIKFHHEKYKFHSNEAKDAENLMHDLHSGNLGISKENKNHFRGAEDEIDAMHNHHLEKMTYHRDKMYQHNNLLDKPLKLKEEAEQIDELSKNLLGRYIKASKSDIRYAGKQYVRSRQDNDEKEKRYADKLAQKRYKGVNMAVDKLTKEEVIDSVFETYINDKLVSIDPLERLEENLSSLSNKNLELIVNLFNELTEENQYSLIELTESKEGIDELLDYIINGQ